MAEFGYRNDVILTLTSQEQASAALYDSELDEGNYEGVSLLDDVLLTGQEACEDVRSNTDDSPFECAMTLGSPSESEVIISCLSSVCHRREFGGGPVELPVQETADDLAQRLEAIAARKREELEAQAREAVEAQLAALGIA